MTRFRGCFFLLIGILIPAFFLHSVGAEPFGLVVQDAAIAPAVAEIGEPVSVNMIIKNVGEDTMSCIVTAFCVDCVAGIEEISTIAPKDSAPLSFLLNTSNLSSGVYSVEVLIEKPSGQQKTFDLGSVTIERDDSPLDAGPTIPETPSPAAIAYWQFLLPVVPAGAIASILILRKRRNKSQEPGKPEGHLPYFLNEILKFDERTETRTQNSIAREKKYIS